MLQIYTAVNTNTETREKQKHDTNKGGKGPFKNLTGKDVH